MFMKKIISLIILGCLSIYGFSIIPINLLVNTGECVNTITAQSPVTTNDYTELFTLVDVVITVTFTECPDYKCSFPAGCTFDICIYDAGYNLVDCQSFSPTTCSYIFRERMQDNQTIYAHLIRTSGSCTIYNQGYAQGYIPTGGGNVSINTTYCP